VTALPRRVGRDAGTILFCFPYGGGGARIYDCWTRHLPETFDVLTAQLPGREARITDLPPDSLQELASRLVRETGAYLTGRLVLFGHSMGALLAFEFSRELRRLFGYGPACLVVSGMRAPHLLTAHRTSRALSDTGLRDLIIQTGRVTPDIAADDELWEIVLPTIRSDIRICEKYRLAPGPPLDCPLIAYGSYRDDGIDARLLGAWREQTTGPFEYRMFDGDHFFFTCQPEVFAADLAERLGQQLGPTSGPTGQGTA
jgi:medium-chain acyl-[acyl-carrier-protein] hydrolase